MKRLNLILAAAVIAGALAFSPGARAAQEIVLGGAISATGRYSEPANRMLNAYKMFVEERNARGGWMGKKIKFVALDDKSDTQTSVKLYEKLITEDKVDFLVGPYSSGITEAVSNVVERYKYPTMGPGASSLSIWSKGRKYIFNVLAVAQDYQKGSLHIAKELGIKRIAIIGEDTLFPLQVAEGAVEWAKKLGLTVVLNENYPPKQTDFTALLQKIKSRRAEAVISNSYFADAAAQIRQLKEQNINVKMFSGTVGPALPRFARDLGPIAEYVLGFSQWEPKPEILKNPGMKEFVENYKKRYGATPNYHAGQGYAALQIFEEAVKKAGSLDRQKVWAALRQIETTTILGRWKVDGRNLNEHEGITFQILDGQRKIVWPKKYAEIKYQLPMPAWDKRAKN